MFVRNLAVISQLQQSGDNYLRRLVTRVTSISRAGRLKRQFGEIEQRSLELPRSYRTQLTQLIARECGLQLADEETRADSAEELNTVDACIDRVRSENVQLRMRGIASWIGIVYLETRGAADAENEALHRLVLRVIRLLKESTGQSSARTSEA